MPAIGRQLNAKYKLGARHALYRRDENGSITCNDFPAFYLIKADSFVFKLKKNMKPIQAFSMVKTSMYLME